MKEKMKKPKVNPKVNTDWIEFALKPYLPSFIKGVEYPEGWKKLEDSEDKECEADKLL